MVPITQRHDGTKYLLEIAFCYYWVSLPDGFMPVLSPVLSPNPFLWNFQFPFMFRINLLFMCLCSALATQHSLPNGCP